MSPHPIARSRRRAARAAALLLAAGTVAATMAVGLAQPATASVVRQPLTGFIIATVAFTLTLTLDA